MSPRKKRPVLYELMSRSPQPHVRSAATPGAASGEVPSPAPFAGEPWSHAPTEPIERAAGPSGVLRVGGGRIHLTLAWPQVAVLGVLLVVALFAAFQVGARSARPGPKTPSNLENILSGQPDSGEPEAEPAEPRPGLRPNGGGAAVPPVPPKAAERQERAVGNPPPPPEAEPAEHFAFKEGYSYLVIQHVSKSAAGQQAAEKIRTFLVSSGVPCTVRPGSKDMEVVATEPFLTKQGDAATVTREKQRADQLKERVRKLGQEYNISGGYSFEGCYLRTF